MVEALQKNTKVTQSLAVMKTTNPCGGLSREFYNTIISFVDITQNFKGLGSYLFKWA